MNALTNSCARLARRAAVQSCSRSLSNGFVPSAGPSRVAARLRTVCTSSPRQSDAQPNPPKRPSPYRLLQPHTFIAEFAPLHTEGWRLDAISSQERMINPLSPISISLDEQNSGDLQDRRLVRAFALGEGKEGWMDTMKLAQRAGQVIEEQDHHPTIVISPASDYMPSSSSLFTESQFNNGGYILEISTHTHTPLPPYPTPIPKKTTTDANIEAVKIRPGVTGKDINLARRLEEVWKEVMGGRERVEAKRE
ncbi:hypothetical protein I317_04129 [Kwoniella heveanensis CBS 569]|nr:hypothetical protein I317_04129 [Kwoniella heveanensis CBS 569]